MATSYIRERDYCAPNAYPDELATRPDKHRRNVVIFAIVS